MNIFKHLNKSEIINLCEKIDMPKQATDEVLYLIDSYDFKKAEPFFDLLFDVKTGGQAVENFNKLFEGNEKAKFLWLTISLVACLNTKDNYKAMGISDKIFYDTMGCFSRFVKEHKESYLVYGYDRQFWSYRQLSQTLYRIGELEFELLTRENDDFINEDIGLKKGDNIISVHIPSDAKINKENCKKSYKMAVEFFNKFYPNFNYQFFWCKTWLLSPYLKDILPQTSNILQFQSDYTVINIDKESESYKLWVFKNSNLTVENFPEDTSLQRNIKKHILNGGVIGEGECVINKNNFK